MSATINLELFTAAFPSAPLIRVPGRLYPIEIHYRPTTMKLEDELLAARSQAEKRAICAQSTTLLL
jgi:HrpA-like RNA helicase